MALIQLAPGGQQLKGDANGSAHVILYGPDGLPLVRQDKSARAVTDYGMPMMGVNDDNYRVQRMDRLGGTALALNTLLFHEPFEGGTVSTNRLVQVVSTMVQAQTAVAGLDLNSTGLIGAGNASLVYTLRQFHKYQRAPLHAKFRLRPGHVTNAAMEWGFGNTTTATASPTIGAYFQITPGGVIQGVLTFNGTDTPTTAITLSGGWQTNYYTFDVILDDDEATFIIQDTSTGLILAERRIQLAATQQRLWNATKLAVFARQHNVSAPVSAPKLLLNSLDVVMVDMATNKPWAHTMSMNGFGADTQPVTFAQAATNVNSAALGSTTLANAGPGGTTLGGFFQFAALAGANTDYVLFGYQVPAPYTLIVTGIEIDSWNSGAVSAGTPTLMIWEASPDMAAATLASGTQRRAILGAQYFPVGAVVGQKADRNVSVDFSNGPLVTNPGRFFDIVLKVPVSTATPSQLIQGFVTVKGYYE